MRSFVLSRLLWALPTLLAISFVTFSLIELAPGDQAVLEAEQASSAAAGTVREQAERVRRLMILHGLVDPETGARRSFWSRYGRWLKHAAVLDFAGDPLESARFRQRILDALPVTALLNALALLFALGIAVPLAARAGMRPGGPLDKTASAASFLLWGTPEFLLATLLLLCFGGGFFAPLLPTAGLSSVDATALGRWAQLLDLARHLVLPVGTLATGYGVVVFRFLRESVARAARSDFALALRGFGVSDALFRRRVLKNGLSPVVTILGAMLPALVSGTVVVESVFSIRGLGWLTLQAVSQREMAMVMALTMLVSIATLIGLLLSDLAHRMVDPRVELR
ncbi:MAG: ABC transporter permease [Planctomycetes bacterium]|nr:ABC transporter permease [Planctomycetota bacterium]MCB9887962.1 ABC transporter permease [Planctomycetota bacterium]